MTTLSLQTYTIQASMPAAPASAASNQSEVPNTYNGQLIDSKSIINLGPQAPQEVQQVAAQLVAQHPQLVDALLGYDSLTGDIKPLMVKAKAQLAQDGIVNKSNWNYVFALRNSPDWLVKIAGPANRDENISVLAHHVSGAPYYYGRPLAKGDADAVLLEHLSDDEFDQEIKDQKPVINKDAHKTFQTISRYAYYLAFLNAQKQHGFKHVTVPETYLVHIPGRPTDVSDRNYMVVERQITGGPVETLTHEEAEEAETAIKEIGLFQAKRDDFWKEASTGKLVLLDMEQPNNSNPRDFFHKNRAKFEGNANCGLQHFRESFKGSIQEKQDKK